MSKKRSRKPTTGYREARPRAVEEEPKRPEASGLFGWLAKPGPGSPWPTIPRALSRGFVTVGSSPVILLSGFLLLLAMWVSLVALGFQGPLGRIVHLLALPPVGPYFDAGNANQIYGSPTPTLIATAAFVVFRGIVLALESALIVRSYEGGGSYGVTLVRGLRIVPVTVAVNVLSLTILLAGNMVMVMLGPGLGFLALMVALVASIFLFVFAPILALREPERPMIEAIRRGARVALLPGSRHLLMSIIYIFLTLPILIALVPEGALLGVNPSLATWVYALLCTFLHLSFLAAFAYRVMAVEAEIPEQPVRLRRR